MAVTSRGTGRRYTIAVLVRERFSFAVYRTCSAVVVGLQTLQVPVSVSCALLDNVLICGFPSPG